MPRCGHLDQVHLACGKAPRCAQDYQSRISGPMFDRIDIHADVPAVNPLDLSAPAATEDSRAVAARITAARKIQTQRFGELGAAGVATNAEADGELLEQVAAPEADGRALLTQAAEAMLLSARG